MRHLDRYFAERRARLDELVGSDIDPGHLEHERIAQDEIERRLANAPPIERLKWANSYSRMPALLDCYGRGDFWSLFGRHWNTCDNVSEFTDELLPILRKARRHAPMRSAMDANERAALDGLPDVVTIWRGCYYCVNEEGFCWTLSREVAAKFPMLHRYRMPEEQAVLLEGRIEKRRILFYANGRGEQEIVALMHDIRIVNQYDIDAAQADGEKGFVPDSKGERHD